MTTKNLPVLGDLAKRVNEEHEACRTAMRSAVEHAVRAGELLIEAKAGLPHGEWGAWLEANCTFSDRTARSYMRLAHELPTLDEEKRQRVAEMPLRHALSAVASVDSIPWPLEEDENGYIITVPFNWLIKLVELPDEDTPLIKLFDRLALLLFAYQGKIKTLPPVDLPEGEVEPTQAKNRKGEEPSVQRAVRDKITILSDAKIRCEGKMGHYLRELERRDYIAPMRFNAWLGEAPWLDLQVLEVTAGKQHLQLRSENDLVPVSALLRENFEKVRTAHA